MLEPHCDYNSREIYPDEVLVSALARRANSGDKRIKPSIQRLFGFGHKKISLDLPSSIGMLTENKVLTMPNEQIIQNHTLFPLFQPFLTEAQATKVNNAMIDDRGSAIHFTAGIMASVVRQASNLKLCPGCVNDDYLKYGEPYWHLIHQLPGVLECPKHFYRLISHCSVCGENYSILGKTKHGICPTHCPMGHDLTTQMERAKDDKSILISTSVSNIFELCQRAVLKNMNFHLLYQERLKNLGMCSTNGRVEQARVSLRFNQFYSLNLLESLGIPTPRGVDSWLSCILRAPRRAFHPLLHILVILSLWDNIEFFLKDYNKIAQEGIWVVEKNPNARRSLRRQEPRCRVDWIERDEKLTQRIFEALIELRSSSGKPIRITISRIGREIRQLALVERHISKLPMSKLLLDINIESVEQHQKNKIEWAVDTLLLENQVVARWSVLRKAGIRLIAAESVEEFLLTKLIILKTSQG